MVSAEMNTSLADDLAAQVEALRRSTVQVRGRGPGGGSGVIWNHDGLIVTNAHVARGPDAVVTLHDDRELQARVVSRDERLDLAALEVEGRDLPAASIGDSSTLRVGQLVLAVGNPLGMVGAAAIGIIHAIASEDGGRGSWVQADVRLLPGNSGGPLADARGQVVGINSMVAGGLGLAVPSNAVERFLQYQGARPQLGLITRPVLVPVGGEQMPGLLVLEVATASAAATAGMGIGDVIIGVNGRLFRGPRDLATLRIDWGDQVVLDILRGGVRLQIDARVEAPERRAA
jgi:serine protease Do